jgi:formylglycine-generating enzyme required for sulfatase activity
MRKSFWRSSALLLVAITIANADSLSVQNCMIDKSRGSVWVRQKDNGIWLSSSKAGQCNQGYTLKTEDQSQLVATFEPSITGTLEENSLLRLDKMLINRAKKNVRMLLELQKGTLRLKMEPLFGYTALVTIRTPSASVDISDAEATVAVTNDTTVVIIDDGTAKVRQIAGTAKSVLHAGTKAVVAPNNPDVTVLPLSEERAQSVTQKDMKIAILSIQSSTVSKDNLDRVSDFIANEMEKKSSTKVLYLEDIRAMLQSEGLESLLLCYTDSCLSKIGSAIGVDAVIMGGLGQIGNNYLFSLKLIDVLRNSVMSRENVKVSGDIGKILDEIPGMVTKLAHPNVAQPAVAATRPKAAAPQTSKEPAAGNAAPDYRETVAWIKGGKFAMGSKATEGEIDESPPHNLTIHSFYLDKFEVTKQDYERVMGANPSTVKGCDHCPVDNVSWLDADQYCSKVGKRLPTEAEWEYACRAGTTTQFSYGNTLSSEQANFNGRFPFGGVPEGPSHDRAVPVGTYHSNTWGLYDMHGNVAEWCYDWYDQAYYGNSADVDPLGPKDGKLKVVRGGAFNQKAASLRSARRAGYNPSMRLSNIGFRCAQDDTSRTGK